MYYRLIMSAAFSIKLVPKGWELLICLLKLDCLTWRLRDLDVVKSSLTYCLRSVCLIYNCIFTIVAQTSLTWHNLCIDVRERFNISFLKHHEDCAAMKILFRDLHWRGAVFVGVKGVSGTGTGILHALRTGQSTPDLHFKHESELHRNGAGQESNLGLFAF